MLLILGENQFSALSVTSVDYDPQFLLGIHLSHFHFSSKQPTLWWHNFLSGLLLVFDQISF